jgi:phenolic acid decarboxylase
MMCKFYRRTKTVETQFGKIVENQTIIFARFARKPEPNPVEDLKITRIKKQNREREELDYNNAPSPDYSMEDLVKMITVKNLGIDNRQFIHEVACKVHELEEQYKKLAEKLLAKLDDI